MLLLAFALQVGSLTRYFVTSYPARLNSDSATKIIISAAIIDTGELIPVSWNYAEEIWTWAPHVFAFPAVAIFGVSQKAHIAADLTGLVAFVLAAVFCLRALRVSWLVIVGTLVILSSATSRLTSEFLFSQLAYMPSAVMAFTLVGLAAYASRMGDSRRRWWIRAAMVLLTIIAGSGSNRLSIQLALPLFFAMLLSALRRGARRQQLWDTASIGAGMVGALACLTWLRHHHTVVTTLKPSEVNLANIGAKIEPVAKGLGFLVFPEILPGLDASEVWQIVLVASLALFVVAGTLAAWRKREAALLFLVWLGQSTLTLAACLTTNVFVSHESARYFLLPWLLLVMVAAVGFDAFVAQRRIPASVTLSLTLFAPWPTHAALHLAPVNAMPLIEIAEQLREMPSCHGYATYWNAAPLTVLTDGKCIVAAVELDGESATPYRWLNDDHPYTNNIGKPSFLLLSPSEWLAHGTTIATRANVSLSTVRELDAGYRLLPFSEDASTLYDWPREFDRGNLHVEDFAKLELSLGAITATHAELRLSNGSERCFSSAHAPSVKLGYYAWSHEGLYSEGRLHLPLVRPGETVAVQFRLQAGYKYKFSIVQEGVAWGYQANPQLTVLFQTPL